MANLTGALAHHLDPMIGETPAAYRVAESIALDERLRIYYRDELGR